MALSGPYAPDNLTRPDDWRRDAECSLSTTDLFHPDHSGTGPHHAAEAKTICRRCRAQVPCLEFALRTREPWGVWGGLDEGERVRLLAEFAAGAADGAPEETGAEEAPAGTGP